jgi:pimeloyl-ACP methyl ester carboxylesterase
MPETRSGDHTIYYEVFGDGPRVLFLNGSGATIESTRLLLDVLAKKFTVAVHDQRGLGKSGCPQGPYTMADYANDGRAVLDALNWTTCRVVGISFGGMVAQEFAVTWPHMVERLVLMCTSAGGPLGSSYPLHTLADLDAAERATRSLQLMDTRFTSEWLAVHPADQALVADAVRRATVPKTAEQLRGEREQLLARSFHDVSSRLGRITAPTFVACGQFDGIAPAHNSVAIAAEIPNAELHTYEGGHMFMVQDRSAFPDIFTFLLADKSS